MIIWGREVRCKEYWIGGYKGRIVMVELGMGVGVGGWVDGAGGGFALRLRSS